MKLQNGSIRSADKQHTRCCLHVLKPHGCALTSSTDQLIQSKLKLEGCKSVTARLQVCGHMLMFQRCMRAQGAYHCIVPPHSPNPVSSTSMLMLNHTAYCNKQYTTTSIVPKSYCMMQQTAFMMDMEFIYLKHTLSRYTDHSRKQAKCLHTTFSTLSYRLSIQT